MRMLGTMYYNGLNVQQDTREGIRWYRKAAAAGSVAARKDLEQLGIGQDAN
jgi:TPR repeat protein